MAHIIVLGTALAFIVFGACERVIPQAGKLLGPLSGLAFAVLALGAVYLVGSWGIN